ncbi:MAG: hypothetical protein ABIP71_05735 [Verrucomicrobiota bacterium]
MKVLIAIVIVVGVCMGVWEIYTYWDDVQQQKQVKAKAAEVQEAADRQLPGLAPALEGPLEAARRQGATGLRQFLIRYGHVISDPRLASIELDYVVLVAREDPVEAKKVFARVEQRMNSASPVHKRVEQLEKTYK